MAISQGFIDTIADVLRPLGTISVRKMFGGAAMYCDGQVFALLSDDVLYLKVDEQTRGAFEAEACGPFTYTAGTVTQVMTAYHKAPDRLLDDEDDLRDWARTAVTVGRRAARAAPAKRAAKGPAKAGKSAKLVSPKRNPAKARSR